MLKGMIHFGFHFGGPLVLLFMGVIGWLLAPVFEPIEPTQASEALYSQWCLVRDFESQPDETIVKLTRRGVELFGRESGKPNSITIPDAIKPIVAEQLKQRHELLAKIPFQAERIAESQQFSKEQNTTSENTAFENDATKNSGSINTDSERRVSENSPKKTNSAQKSTNSVLAENTPESEKETNPQGKTEDIQTFDVSLSKPISVSGMNTEKNIKRLARCWYVEQMNRYENATGQEKKQIMDEIISELKWWHQLHLSLYSECKLPPPSIPDMLKECDLLFQEFKRTSSPDEYRKMIAFRGEIQAAFVYSGANQLQKAFGTFFQK